MFQFIRRVSGSLFPRPDRPWREDATSHAPTIGRKRRHSVTEQDNGDSPSPAAKRAKSDSVSEGDTSNGDLASPVEIQEVKEVTKGVEEVDLEDKDNVEETSSPQPEGVPLPESPSGSPEPEAESEPPRPADLDVAKDQEYERDEDSVNSSAPEDHHTEEATEVLPDTTSVPADDTTVVQEDPIATLSSNLYDTAGTLEVNA